MGESPELFLPPPKPLRKGGVYFLGGRSAVSANDPISLAFALAEQGQGLTSPNPPVGAVVVRDGRVIGCGYHQQAGAEHAEVLALREAGREAAGATLYVTLEPCNHYGRTPPCTEAILAAGIERVVVAFMDPNPLVRGKGLLTLARAGVRVTVGSGWDRASELYGPFQKFITTATSYVALKMAVTLDGRIATGGGDSRWITSYPARRLGHRWRATFDGVITGVGTVLRDNPQLTVRLVSGRNPRRFVLDSQARIPLGARCLEGEETVVVVTEVAPPKQLAALEEMGVQVWRSPLGEDGRVDLAWFLRETARRGLVSLLLEAGGHLSAAFQALNLVDRYYFFFAPKLVGGSGVGPFEGPGKRLMEDAYPLRFLRWEQVGNDLLITAEPVREVEGW